MCKVGRTSQSWDLFQFIYSISLKKVIASVLKFHPPCLFVFSEIWLVFLLLQIFVLLFGINCTEIVEKRRQVDNFRKYKMKQIPKIDILYSRY